MVYHGMGMKCFWSVFNGWHHSPTLKGFLGTLEIHMTVRSWLLCYSKIIILQQDYYAR